MTGRKHYELLAGLFAYPDAGYPGRVAVTLESVEDRHPAAAGHLRSFLELLPADSLARMTEMYTRSFDVQAITTLDVGYLLFGDDYKRGELLAGLNKEHVRLGIDCGGELADHLPNLLRLVGRLDDDPELLTDLVTQILEPGIRTMLAEFNPERVTQKERFYEKRLKTLIEAPDGLVPLYGHAIAALYEVLCDDFDLTRSAPTELDQSGGFLGALQREMAPEQPRQNHTGGGPVS